MDRIDVHIETHAVEFNDFQSSDAMSTADMIEISKVGHARQAHRFQDNPNYFNAHMSVAEINQHCTLSPAGNDLLKYWLDSSKSSARSYHKILKLARTIADLADCADISDMHISKAIQYRSLDHSFFA